MSLAHDHSNDPSAQEYWRRMAQESFASGHPSDRDAIFYKNFDDGTMIQVNVSPDGKVTIAPGQQYNDEEAERKSREALNQNAS